MSTDNKSKKVKINIKTNIEINIQTAVSSQRAGHNNCTKNDALLYRFLRQKSQIISKKLA